MDERQIYEAVKRILSAKGSIDINELQKDLQQGSAPAPAAASRSDVGRYQQIKRIMENTTWFGSFMVGPSFRSVFLLLHFITETRF